MYQGRLASLGRNPVNPAQRYSKDQIYAYSRSSGLYGGVSLEGSELSFNSKRNREFYGQDSNAASNFCQYLH